MKTTMLKAILAVTILTSGCSTSDTSQSNSSQLAESVSEPSTSSQPSSGSVVEEEAYDGIAITAAVLVRKAILPGAAIPVTVTIKNSGEKIVVYTHGSGSSTTPDALTVTIAGLQTVHPKDRMGPNTMDMQMSELSPGEELQYVMYVMAIQTNDQFDNYSFDLFMNDGTYIAEMEWAELQAAYPDLLPAQSGSYDGKALFSYSVMAENGQIYPTVAPTDAAQSNFVIAISE